jgi:hypothetical protein
MSRGKNFSETLFMQKSCFDGANCLLRLFFVVFLRGGFGMPKRFERAQTLLVILQEYPVE